MKQISSKFNMYITSVSVINNNIERLAFDIIFLSFGVLALSYVFLLGNIVKNVVERQSLEVRVRALTSEVRNLEITYFSMSSGVDLALSYSMGFKNTQATFATRKALGLNSLGSRPMGDAMGESFGGIKIGQNDI